MERTCGCVNVDRILQVTCNLDWTCSFCKSSKKSSGDSQSLQWNKNSDEKIRAQEIRFGFSGVTLHILQILLFACDIQIGCSKKDQELTINSQTLDWIEYNVLLLLFYFSVSWFSESCSVRELRPDRRLHAVDSEHKEGRSGHIHLPRLHLSLRKLRETNQSDCLE